MSWRLDQVERRVNQLVERQDERHEQNRDKLENISKELGDTRGEIREIKRSVEHIEESHGRLTKALWGLVLVVITSVVAATMRLVLVSGGTAVPPHGPRNAINPPESVERN